MLLGDGSNAMCRCTIAALLFAHAGMQEARAQAAATEPLPNPAKGSAQGYPAKSVRFIVPFPPGGATDIISRALGAKLTAALGQQFVIDNRAGGGQKIGTAITARSPADGYTMQLVSVTHSINPSLDDKLPYDTLKDFAPVTLLALSPNIVVLHPAVPATSIKALIALARAHPGKLNLATSGNGSGGHLAAAYFQSLAGIRMTTVPYKGGSPAFVDMLSGQTQVMFTSPNPTLSFVKAGKLRAIAMTSAKRSPAAPELPTVAEAAGFPGYEASLWYGIMLPAGTPRDILQLLHSEIIKAAKTREFGEPLAAFAIEIIASTPDEFAAYLGKEMKKWAKVIKDANIRAD
jgi:tripartite-type tricarboxylate transporter receptor subunit TctC